MRRWVHILSEVRLLDGPVIPAGTLAEVLEDGGGGVTVRTFDPPGVTMLAPHEYESLNIEEVE